MSYEIEKTGDLSRVATVTVTAEDFQKQVNRELRELSKQVKLKGFRAGKVPLSVMRQRYGASVQQEVVEKLVNEELNRLVEEEGNVLYLEILEPPDQMEGANEGQIGFKVELELRPEVDPVGYVGIEVERPEPEVHDEELGEQLEALREEYATLEPIALRDTVREGDVVNLDFKALGEGDDFEQLQGDDVNITVGSGEALPGIEEGLIGAKFNASQTITVQLDEDFPMESLRGREVRLEVQINSVKKRVLPALDDEFAVDTGRGQTLLELRGNVRKEISEAKGTYADRLAERDLLDKLLEQHAFRVPPKFLEQQVRQTVDQRLEMLREQGIDPEEMGLDREKLAEDVRDQRERQLRTEFLLMGHRREGEDRAGEGGSPGVVPAGVQALRHLGRSVRRPRLPGSTAVAAGRRQRTAAEDAGLAAGERHGQERGVARGGGP